MSRASLLFLACGVFCFAVNRPAARADMTSGADHPAPIGSGDSLRSSGVGSTTNRPTDDAPHSAHPSEPITDTASAGDRDEAVSKEGALSRGDRLRKTFQRTIQTKLSNISSRLLSLENKGGVVAQNLKEDFARDVVRVRGEEKNIALQVDGLTQDGHDKFEKAKKEISQKVAGLENEVRQAEKKYLK